MQSNDWNYPTSIRVGLGRADELADACGAAGIRRPLLITDKFLGATDMVDRAVQGCREALGTCGLFDDVKGNPTGTNVAQGLEAFKSGGYDGVIAFGGGSALDAAKAVAQLEAMLAEFSGEATDFFDTVRGPLGRLLGPGALARLEAHLSRYEFEEARLVLSQSHGGTSSIAEHI